MPKAIWKGEVIAEAAESEIEKVEGNIYFPPESLKREHLTDSKTTSKCPWKGTANYYNVTVGGETNADAAWVYRAPFDAARQIKDHVAFWKGVTVEA